MLLAAGRWKADGSGAHGKRGSEEYAMTPETCMSPELLGDEDAANSEGYDEWGTFVGAAFGIMGGLILLNVGSGTGTDTLGGRTARKRKRGGRGGTVATKASAPSGVGGGAAGGAARSMLATEALMIHGRRYPWPRGRALRGRAKMRLARRLHAPAGGRRDRGGVIETDSTAGHGGGHRLAANGPRQGGT